MYGTFFIENLTKLLWDYWSYLGTLGTFILDGSEVGIMGTYYCYLAGYGLLTILFYGVFTHGFTDPLQHSLFSRLSGASHRARTAS